MGKIYSAPIGAVAVTAIQDFFSIKAATAVPVQLLGLFIAQNSDFGDAQDEGLRWQVKIGATTQGSGGSAITPHNGANDTSGATVHANDTTQSSAGTALLLHEDVFNVRAGLIWMPPPKMIDVFKCPGGQIIQIALPAAPADSLTMSGTVYWEEL